MDWREHYKSRLVTPDEAVKVVKSGDFVNFPIYPHARPLIHALAARKDQLSGVRIHCDSPAFDPGWLRPGWQDSFSVTIEQILGELGREAYGQRIVDYLPMIFSTQFKPHARGGEDSQPIDVSMLVVSPPDESGFCSFGAHLWNKKSFVKWSKKIVAQVDRNQIRTYGNNYVHITELDYFVEDTPPVLSDEEINDLVRSVPDPQARAELESLIPLMEPRERSEFVPQMVGLTAGQIREFGVNRCWLEPPDEARRVSEYVSELVKDGSTIQIGTGTPSRFLVRLGTFDHHRDLGWHSEMGAPGMVKLIEKGVVTGERKTIHKGKATFSALTGCTPSEHDFANNNPLIELFDAEYVANARTVARYDNMVAINNALAVDFSGQINAETVFGARLLAGTGGQLDFQMGAVMSRGGRAITLIRATAMGGAVSRIVPQLEEGSVVTVPRTFADTVVTEYGVAQLLGKSIRERAKELINVAHPDFRADLKRAAERLSYP